MFQLVLIISWKCLNFSVNIEKWMRFRDEMLNFTILVWMKHSFEFLCIYNSYMFIKEQNFTLFTLDYELSLRIELFRQIVARNKHSKLCHIWSFLKLLRSPSFFPVLYILICLIASIIISKKWLLSCC